MTTETLAIGAGALLTGTIIVRQRLKLMRQSKTELVNN